MIKLHCYLSVLFCFTFSLHVNAEDAQIEFVKYLTVAKVKRLRYGLSEKP